jgi:beta-glucosidase-like glycosyl hydrolase
MTLNLPSGTLAPVEKLYQLIITGLDGNRIGEEVYRHRILQLTKKGIGGFIIFGGARNEVKSFLTSLQSHAKTPLFIASDIERGVGQQITGTTTFPCRMAFEAAINPDDPDDCALLRRSLHAIASEAIDCGINMPLFPVFGANQDPDNPIICMRAFSDGPEQTAWLGAEHIRIFEDMGLLPWGKHFPRHGTTAADSHISAPAITKSREGLMQTEDPDIAVEQLTSALERGEISQSQIDAALARTGKDKARIPAYRTVTVDYTRNEALADEIAEKAITLVKGHGKFLPVRESDTIPLVFAGNEGYFQSSPLRYYVKQASHITKPLPIRDRPSMFVIFTDMRPWKGSSGIDPEERDRVKQLMKGTSQSIVISFGSPYVLDYFREADILIAAYDTDTRAQDAVFKCISGERAFQGRLPIELGAAAHGR